MFTVLVVDDKEVFRRKMKRLPYWSLHKEQFQIEYEAPNGVEALKFLKENKIDVVVTDIRMPFIDGIELLKQIRANNLCGCVILLSEYAEFNYAREGILNGAFDYIVKPLDNDKIEETFERVYNYLTTIKKTLQLDAHRIESLIEFLLSRNEKNTLAYASHMDTELLDEVKDAQEAVVRMNDVLRQMRDRIISKRPYLQNYLPVETLFQIDVRSISSKQLETVFSERVMNIYKHIEPFHLYRGNAMVQKMCVMALAEDGDKLNIREIADNFFVNQKYLGSLFKQEMRVSFSQYQTFLKMQRAKILFEDQNLRIYEVAELLGYEDIDYFSKMFKKETGKSPSTYREMIIHGRDAEKTEGK